MGEYGVRIAVGWVLLVSVVMVMPGWAQAPEGVAALNAESKRLSESDAEASMALAAKAYAEARRTGDLAGEAEALHNEAVAYLMLGALDLALEKALESAGRYSAAGDPKGEAQGHNTAGLVALDAGELAAALEHHARALAIREQSADKVGIAFSFNNLGNVQRHMGNYARALEYHDAALTLKRELGDRSSEAFSHQNQGLVYQAMGDRPAALAAFERALAIRESLGDDRGAGQTLIAIGQVQMETDPRAALRTYDRSLAARRRVGDVRGEAATLVSIGDAYRQLRDIPRSRATLVRAHAMVENDESPLLRANVLRALADTEKAAGNPGAALAWFEQHVEVRDRLFNQQNAERNARLATAHEIERRERRIALLEKDGALAAAAINRATLIRTGLLVLLVLAGVILQMVYARYRTQKRTTAKLQEQAAELETALGRVHTLRGLLPICAHCKKIRDDNGYWTKVEAYVMAHSAAQFTHGICPPCTAKHYPEFSMSRGPLG